MPSFPEMAPDDIYTANVVAGYPKTGRTWLRYMMAHSLLEEAGIELEVDLTNMYQVIPNDSEGTIEGQPVFAFNGLLPLIEMTHTKFDDSYEAARKVFLTRDPRDVMVSHWMHNTRQIKITEMGLSDFIRDPRQGIDNFIAHLDSWSPHLTETAVIAYEVMRMNPAAALGKAFGIFQVQVSERNIQVAVEAGAMGKMRDKEIRNGIAGHDYDRTDPDALRIRSGKIGGYTDHLSGDDLRYIDDRIQRALPTSKHLIALTGYVPETTRSNS
jgi:alcohol sulfotransferase